MTTEKQVQANQRNAQSSTGPRTEEGKRIVSMNALRHSLTASEDWELPTDDKEEYERLRERMLAELDPHGAVEEQLAEEIIRATRRLLRAESLELGLFACGVATADEEFLTGQRSKYEVTEGDVRKYAAEQAGLDAEYVLQITNPYVHETLTDLIDEAGEVRRSDEGRLAMAFIKDATGPNAFAKFSRYETTLFNRRNKLLDQLKALQDERRTSGKEVKE